MFYTPRQIRNSDYCNPIQPKYFQKRIIHVLLLLSFFILDAISQNFASCKKKRRQEQSGTYERYQQEQKRRQRMKRVWISLISQINYFGYFK